MPIAHLVNPMGIENVVFAILLMTSIFLAAIALAALYRGRTWRMFFVAAAFSTFLVKAGILVAYLFTDFTEPQMVFIVGAMLDTIALLLLYAGVLKR